MSSQSGYIAITSAIIITVLLFSITFTLSFFGFFTRFNALNFEHKKISRHLAEGCFDMALMLVANNQELEVVEGFEFNVGESVCQIESVVGNSEKTIYTSAVSRNAHTGLEIKILANDNDITILSWREY